MAWPEWAGPFGVPTTSKELEHALWSTMILTGVYTVFYAIEVWRTIPRMAFHHYANPSRNAIIRAAARQTIFPTFTRGAGMLVRAIGLPFYLVTGAILVKQLVGEKVEYDFDRARIDRAREAAMGEGWQFTGTHDMFYFGDSPHTETRYGEQWYSFHPEWI